MEKNGNVVKRPDYSSLLSGNLVFSNFVHADIKIIDEPARLSEDQKTLLKETIERARERYLLGYLK